MVFPISLRLCFGDVLSVYFYVIWRGVVWEKKLENENCVFFICFGGANFS